MERSTRLEPETLLAHAGWLRQLAASLVSDPGTADDVLQDTWLAALRHPPAGDRPLEPWLARVARNFALRRRRSELRRVEHELAAEPSCEPPTPEQTVERLALQRSVVEAVLAIDEPFRTAIVQRYFEGHSAAEIARMHGVPAGTVRWRLMRGLAELRERLDARFGSRASWCIVLAPFARRGAAADPGAGAPSATTSGVLRGVLVMSATQWVAAVAGIAVVAGIVWWSFAGRGTVEPVSAVGSPAQSPMEPLATLEPTPSAAQLAPVPRDPREAVARETASEPAAPVTADSAVPRTATVDARFVDATGAPWSGVRFESLDKKLAEAIALRNARLAGQMPALPVWQWSQPALSQADGRVQLELVFPDFGKDTDGQPIRSSHLDFIASRSGCTTVARSAFVRVGETTHLGDIVLGPAVRLSGRVLDEQGHGIPHATVGSTAAQLPPEEDGHLRRHGSTAFDVPMTESSDDGTFVLDGVGAGTWRLWGHAPATCYAWSEPIPVTVERDLAGLELVLTPLLSTDRIEGRIVDPQGAPFSAALFCMVHDPRHGGFGRGEEVDQQGRFSIVIEHDGETWDLSARDFSERFATTSVLGVQPGTLDLVLRMREKQFMDVSVRDAESQPVEGAAFLVGVSGSYSNVPAEASAAGLYRLPVPDAPFAMEVSARGYHTESRRRLDPASSPSPLEVILRHAPFVRGHVVAAGQAVAAAHVELRSDDPAALETVAGYRCVMSSMADVEGRTDADGRFELACDLDGAFWIRVTAAGSAPAEIGPIDAERLAATADFELVLSAGGTLEGHVLLPEGRDAEGAIVAINHGDGAPRTMRAGPHGFFHFEGLAPGKWQVLASEADVDSSQSRYSSLSAAEPIVWSCEVSTGHTTRYDLDLRTK